MFDFVGMEGVIINLFYHINKGQIFPFKTDPINKK